jgi:hypothetical protein
MPVTAGALVFATVEYIRAARYRTRHQAESHRTPRYQIRYQLEDQSAREAMIGPAPSQLLVARIRASKLGDVVEVTLSEDEASVIDWTNQTLEAIWRDFDGTWGESD